MKKRLGWTAAVIVGALLLGVFAAGDASAWDRGRGGYVQRTPSTPVSGYWHYCQDPAGYYPTVAACPSGWIQIAPRTE
jgi:hypothetical protein